MSSKEVFNPLFKLFFVDVEPESERHFDDFTHHFLPALIVIFVPRESIDEVSAGVPAALFHCFLDQVASDRYWDNLSFFYNVVDKFAVLRAAVTL